MNDKNGSGDNIDKQPNELDGEVRKLDSIEPEESVISKTIQGESVGVEADISHDSATNDVAGSYHDKLNDPFAAAHKKQRPLGWMILSGVLMVAMITAIGYIVFKATSDSDTQSSLVNDKAMLEDRNGELEGKLKETTLQLSKLQKDKDSAVEAAQESAIAETKKKYEKEIAKIKKDSSSAQVSNNSYRTIPEWGVRFKATEDNSTISFSAISFESNREAISVYDFIIARKLKDEQGCQGNNAGVIHRLTDSEYTKAIKNPRPSGISANLTSKKINGYVYVYQSPQSSCSSKMVDEQVKASEQAKAIVRSLEVM